MAKQSMDNRVDFNKLRKRRQRTQTVKRLLILLGVTAAIAGIVFLNNILVEQSVTTRLSDLVGSFSGAGFPVDLPGGIIRDVKGSGDHLAVLNDTNLYLYSPKGKVVNNVQQMSDNTVLLAGENRLLTFDVGAKQFSVHSRAKTLLKKDLEYSIIAAGMNDRGDFAMVSSSKQAICEVRVYNKNQAEIYICYFADNLVNSVSVSPKGNMMVTGWINGKEGVLASGVNIYLLSNPEGAVATLELPATLIYDVRFYEDDRIGVLTDKQYMVLSADGTVKSSYDFGGRQYSAVETQARQTLILFENRETRTRELVLLDGDCNEKSTMTTDQKILDIALGARRVYVLTEESIRTYNQALELQQSETMQFATRIRVVSGRLYYLTREEIRVLGQNREQSEEESTESSASGSMAAGTSSPQDSASADEPESRSEPEPSADEEVAASGEQESK